MSKVILLTGATDGIGLLTAQKLTDQGHHVLIHGRNAEKLTVVEEQLSALGQGVVQSFQADLSNFDDVKRLAQSVIDQFSAIDIVINNAGVYKTSAPITQDNLDVRFVVNTLAPYFLTKRLLPLMNSAGRVVNLSSAAQRPVDMDALAGVSPITEQFEAYAQSKLAITMWSRNMALSLGDTGPSIIAVNPGSLLASKMVKEGFGVEGKDLNIGADILLRAALSDDFANASGDYFDNDLGEFSKPHSDVYDPIKCEVLVSVIERQLQEKGLANHF